MERTRNVSLESEYEARWWSRLTDGRLQCDLCPHNCRLREGQRGLCFVRQAREGRVILTTYGRSSGFCLDPIEKKPLYHFYPGSHILSFGTAGCNLNCRYCQNSDISKARDMDRLVVAALPQEIARLAQRQAIRSVAYTYNDPIIFAEYAIDTAQACRALGIQNVAVTAGYVHAEPCHAFFSAMDAANVDLKSFNDDFYHRLCGGRLQTVLDTLLCIHHETTCWLEITTLLIPGHNDTPEELRALSNWIMRELGADVPLHFSAFHPAWKMQDIPITPRQTLVLARRIAQDAGLRYVYTGNVHDVEGGTSLCPSCQASLIVRDGYRLRQYSIEPDGRCPHCQTTIVGRFGDPPDKHVSASDSGATTISRMP